MISKVVVAHLLLITSAISFLVGAYFQRAASLHSLLKLCTFEPYALCIREKLCASLKLFLVSPASDSIEHARLTDIMKYGFPGLDDVRLYSDFVLSYDRRNRVARWVYEHLQPTCLGSNFGVQRQRTSYQADMEVPSDFRVYPEDYQRTGYDRGHLAAAGNHKCHQTHCDETFFLTNIAPQVGKGFNRDAWNKLEIYVRDLTVRYGSVYVCTGPLYLPTQQSNGKLAVEYEVIGPTSIAVPTHFFKVITVESKLPRGKPYMEAFVMPNEPIDNDIDIRTYLCDIRDIERWAGLKFFDGLRRGYFFAVNYPTQLEIFRKFN